MDKLLNNEYRKILWERSKDIILKLSSVIDIKKINVIGSFTTKKERPADVDFIISVEVDSIEDNWATDICFVPSNNFGLETTKDAILWMDEKYGKNNYESIEIDIKEFKKNDNDKIENIKKLLEINGGLKSYNNAIKNIIESIQHLIPNQDKLNDELIDDIINEVIYNNILNELTPIYDKYFNNDEILGIINFYNTNIGKSYLSKMNKVMLESMQIGSKHGELIYEKLKEFTEKDKLDD